MVKVTELLTEHLVTFEEKILFPRNSNAMVSVFSKTHHYICCSIHCDYISNQLDLFDCSYILLNCHKEVPSVEKLICLLCLLVKLSICLLISPLPCQHHLICYYQVWSIVVYDNVNSSIRRNALRKIVPHF